MQVLYLSIIRACLSLLALTAQAMVVVSRRREITTRAAATMTMMMKLDKTGLEGAAGGAQN